MEKKTCKTVRTCSHVCFDCCSACAWCPGNIKKHTSGKQKSYNTIWTMLGIDASAQAPLWKTESRTHQTRMPESKTLQNPNVAACHKISQSLYMSGRPDLSGCLNNLKLLFLFLHTSQQMAIHLHLHAFTRSASP